MKTNAFVVLAIALAAVVVGFGDISAGLTSDADLLVLSSIQKWTPFYPGNDHRYGMLVPLLAMWARSPALNLAVQLTISAAAGLSVFFLVPRYVAPSSSWRTVGAWSSLFWMLAMPRPMLQEWLIQPYGVAMALGVAGLLVMGGNDRGWAALPMGGALLVVAFWVNVGLGLVLAPLWVARQMLRPSSPNFRSEREPWYLLWVMQALWVSYLHDHTEPKYLQVAPLSSLSVAVEHIAAAAPTWILAMTLLGAGLLLFHPRPARLARSTRAAYLVKAGLVSSIPVAMNGWVVANLSAARYFLPMLMLWQVAAVLCAQDDEPGRHWFRPSLAWMVCMAVVAFGWPSFERLRARIVSASKGGMYEQAGCVAIGGDYWLVWPTVLAILELRHETNDPKPAYGVTTRGDFTLGLLANEPSPTYCEVTP